MIPYGVPRMAVLEWGTLTDEPGSQVRDLRGRMLFTGSHVLHGLLECPGVIVELVSADLIVVRWADSVEPERIAPDLVTWVRNSFDHLGEGDSVGPLPA